MGNHRRERTNSCQQRAGQKDQGPQAEGGLDRVTDETPGSSGQGHDAEWRSWLLSNAAEFSQAVDTYREELDHS